MAVEAVIGAVMEEVLEQSLFFAAKEITLFRGCKKSLENLATEVAFIQCLVVDADMKNIKNTGSTVMKIWFKKLKAVMLDAEDVLDEYNYELLRQKIPQKKWEKVRNFFLPRSNLAFRTKMAHKIKEINSELKSVSELGTRYGLSAFEFLNKSSEVKIDRVMTSPSVQEEEIVGRDEDVIKVVDMLVHDNINEKLAVTAIVGMGGMGKTTVAQLVCKHDKVVSHFEKIVWVCVSDDFTIERLLKEIVQSITRKNPKLTNRQALIAELQETLKGKRYLIIFDDVWNEDEQLWELMEKDLLEISGSRGTNILVTTRNHNVCSIMHASKVDLSHLSENESWSLFKKRAFAEGGVEEAPQFVAIGQRIIKRCCGMPLAIKVLGGLLYSKREIKDWLSIENGLSDLWSLTNVQGGVMSCIELSYDHLSSLSLKQCFAYCALFPKDTLMERESLIQQWMAHGFLNPPNGTKLQMEEIGREYVNILLWNSLVQELRLDKETKTWVFKMHDLVHDFALHISKDYCFTMENNDNVNGAIEAVHVSLTCREGIDIQKGISSKIRTLYSNSFFYIRSIVNYSSGNVLLKFGYLRTLRLTGFEIRKLPSSIGMLKLLRYLDIKDTHIRSLPASYIKLYNLQTLRLSAVFTDKYLYVYTLVNLRHIYSRTHEAIIVGIKYLVHLQTLSHFIVSNKKGCKIEELENLDDLRGSLILYNLDKVKNGEEARKANISKKLNIEHLEFHWTNRKRDAVNDEDVLEGLTPHSFLKILVIKYFKGLRFSSWMTTTNNGLLNYLTEVNFEDCDSLEQLPPLGHLPHLRKVYLSRLSSVKSIGLDFYGCTNYVTSTSCAFPALEELHIIEMLRLKEWLVVEHPSPLLQAFPNLRNLLVCDCSELTKLPSLKGLLSLTQLSIKGNLELTKLPSFEGLLSLTHLSIEGNLELTELPSFEGLLSLTQLSIEGNSKLSEIPSLEYLSCLSELSIKIKENDMLTELPSLEGLLSLKRLIIHSYNGRVTAVPVGLERLPNLKTLDIGGFSEELDYFPWPHNNVLKVTSGAENNEDDQLYFGSLENLTLRGWSKVTSLPEQIQYLSSLTSLNISYFDGVEALPEWLGNIKSLFELTLTSNANLTYMPSTEAMQLINNLQTLRIIWCPRLSKRCTRGSGPEWHKISHIPNIHI